MKEIKIKEMVQYAGHSIKGNGSIDINFNARYSELVNSIQLLQMLNNDIQIAVKIGSDKPFKIGSFRLKNVVIDDDGESKLKFNSIIDSVELEAINNMVVTDEFTICMKALIEEEEDEQ